jgi:hypothetical protein
LIILIIFLLIVKKNKHKMPSRTHWIFNQNTHTHDHFESWDLMKFWNFHRLVKYTISLHESCHLQCMYEISILSCMDPVSLMCKKYLNWSQLHGSLSYITWPLTSIIFFTPICLFFAWHDMIDSFYLSGKHNYAQ